jgi:hypothetical protein
VRAPLFCPSRMDMKSRRTMTLLSNSSTGLLNSLLWLPHQEGIWSMYCQSVSVYLAPPFLSCLSLLCCQSDMSLIGYPVLGSREKQALGQLHSEKWSICLTTLSNNRWLAPVSISYLFGVNAVGRISGHRHRVDFVYFQMARDEANRRGRVQY